MGNTAGIRVNYNILREQNERFLHAYDSDLIVHCPWKHD
jgi:hypothetical protein